MPDCVFCMIRDGKIPSAKVYDDARTLAFMDINPLSRGHCLVVPKAHAPTLYDVEVEDLKAAALTAKKVAAAIKKALSPDGLNLLQANGAAAFQSVPHFHLHLIPRFTGDGKGFDWPQVGGDRGEVTKTGEALRAAVAAETTAAPIAAPEGER